MGSVLSRAMVVSRTNTSKVCVFFFIRHYASRRVRVLMELSALVYIIRHEMGDDKSSIIPPWLHALAERLRRYTTLQLLMGSVWVTHLWRHMSLLLGLHAPHSSLYMEPDMHYSPSFARVRWMLTSLDAGVLSTLNVRVPFVRDALSLLMGLWYMVFSSDAEDKVRAFRRSQTIGSLIATWEKGRHPVLNAVTTVTVPKLRVAGEVCSVPSTHGGGGGGEGGGRTIETRVFYDGTGDEPLAAATRVVLHLPGGGFVAMDPMLHRDYLSKWSKQLPGVAIVSVNYRKAPTHPYPAGFNDCFDVYQSLIASEGGDFGINAGGGRLVVVIAGDSAGGNLAAGVTLKAIATGLRRPDGVHLIYPVLDLGGQFWKHTTPLPDDDDDDGGGGGGDDDDDDDSGGSGDGGGGGRHRRRRKRGAGRRARQKPQPPVVTSRARFAFDGVLPQEYLIKIAGAYLRNGGDPRTDHYLSPIRAPTSILAQFPPTCIHVGCVDPLHDDSTTFIQRLHDANPRIRTRLHEFPGVSHAYLHVADFLPEGQHAMRLSVEWLKGLLHRPLPPYTATPPSHDAPAAAAETTTMAIRANL